MNSCDPWEDIALPKGINQINIRRIDDRHPWGLYWGRSREHRLLLARLGAETKLPTRLPKFSGVQLTADIEQVSGARSLMLELLDGQAQDIFLALCQDIIGATEGSTTEQGLIEEIVTRTWMWHRLLETGGAGLLTEEEQRGLIGELSVLNDLCVRASQISSTVDGWTGPLGTPRDFEFGAVCLEVKAKRAAALPYVAISSEYQLDSAGLDALFLIVVDVSTTAAPTGMTLDTIVGNVRDLVRIDGETLDRLDERLAAYGYRASDDYSKRHWSIGESHIYRVVKAFPSLCASDLPSGISRVKYAHSLKECQPFKVPQTYLDRVLERTMNGR